MLESKRGALPRRLLYVSSQTPPGLLFLIHLQPTGCWFFPIFAAFSMYSEMGRVWSWDTLEELVQGVLISLSWMESPILLSGQEAGAAQKEGLWLEAGTQGLDTAASAGRHQVMRLQQKPGRRESP